MKVEVDVTLSITLEGEKIAEFIRKVGRLSDHFGCSDEIWDIKGK